MPHFARPTLKIIRYGLLMLGAAIGLSFFSPLRSQLMPDLPSPEAAIAQADQIAAAELPGRLTQIELDAATRDRLRFDPEWQPIAQAIRQDVMLLKWGNGQLENPVWQQYGAKAYPLLDYYARSADPTRQAYGLLGIRSLGKPYSTLWLEKQLQRRAYQPDFYVLTADPRTLKNPDDYGAEEYDWQKDFGLNDPQVRDRLIQIARENLEPRNSPTYYEQFNVAFLGAVLGYDAIFPSPPVEPAAPAIPEWDRYEQLVNPTDAQVEEIVAYYNQLPQETQDYILVKRLGSMKAGQLSTAGRLFFNAIFRNPQSPDRTWALAELDRHNDPRAEELLETLLNGDLKPLYSLTKLVSYGDFFAQELDKATHAYYLLLNMAQKYPSSRFVRAAREYGNLTGRSYFGGEPRSPILVDRLQQKTPAQRTASWQDWLNRYPDHPGADDATYFLARSFQDQNQILSALDLWVKLMTETIGDGDATYLAWGHLRTLLDVGLPYPQLQQATERYQNSAIAPLFRYALAVREARSHNYAEALRISENLDLTQMSPTVLGSYYSKQLFGSYRPGSDLNAFYKPEAVQARMQTMLTEQRQRWQTLGQLKQKNTPESRYQLASNWAGAEGWKNGYLPVWDNDRTILLPTGDWSNRYCEIYWACNTPLRGIEAVYDSYQQSSQNAIALNLFQTPLTDESAPADLREKALYMAAYTALAQWEDYPLGETFRIHPLPGMTGSLTRLSPSPGADSEQAHEAQQQNYQQIEQDYLKLLDQAIARMQQEFPQSQYIDDLLFSRFAMSGESRYLEEIVTRYPSGDRVTEARFLLERRSNSQP
ncbi:hypothetical protein [Leptolyngbya ohadii]|uniref:hypothetical protein n=1 Tax=Leptolyngbya ohadii TaxID=1962290 RepID=UPI000B5A1610|nr:hypothetical protein [Leptolyngbya ohadii]